MADTALESVLRLFSTGYLKTVVARRPDGKIAWRRVSGRDNPVPYLPPRLPEAARDRLAARIAIASDDRVAFALPVSVMDTGAEWLVPGIRTAAGILLTEEPGAEKLAGVFRALGAGLRRFHDWDGLQDDPAGRGEGADFPPPPGLTRLRTWLTGAQGPRAAPGWHRMLRTRLGPARWDTLGSLAEQALFPERGARVVITHGWFSLGSVILADVPPAVPGAMVLSGVEVSYGRPETDLACAIGELAEFAAVAAGRNRDRPELGTLRQSLLDGYGPGWDARLLKAGEMLRIALHAHDAAAYVGWQPAMHDYARILADLLDRW